jgi:hypothetical protein
MPRVKLTKTVIDALPIPSKDIVHWDTGCPGFGVKVTPKGRKVFVVLYRTAGAGSRLRKYTIGPYGRVTLNQARVTAQKIFAARLDGRDLAAEKKDSRRRMVADRVEDLLEAFIAQHISQNRSAPEISRMLRREVGSAWGSRSVHEISKRDVIDVVSAIEQRGSCRRQQSTEGDQNLLSMVRGPRGTRPVAGRRCAASGKTGDEGSRVERWRTC